MVLKVIEIKQIFFDQKSIWRQIWICPVEKCLILFHSIVWVHFSDKTEEFGFQRSLKYFNMFWSKKWGQIWLCPVKQRPTWFNLCSFSIILAIGWEILILIFIEIALIFQLRNLLSDQNLSRFFLLICIFWHYYRNNFKLKKFLIKIYSNTLMKILYLKGYKWLWFQNHRARNNFLCYRRY